MFIPALFITTKIWKQPYFLAVEGWWKIFWYNHIIEYYASIKTDIIEGRLVNLKDISNIIIIKSIVDKKYAPHDLFPAIQ